MTLQRADTVLTERLRTHVAGRARAVAIPVGDPLNGGPVLGVGEVAGRLAGARLVGLGESTHGTREFSAFRFKLFQDLVIKHGFTLFCLEDMRFAVDPMEDFIQGRGPEDPRATMSDLMWPWATTDMADFLVWARTHNRGKADDVGRIHLVGIDIQKPFRQARHLVALMRASGQPVDAIDALSRIADMMPMADSSNPTALAAQQADPSSKVRWHRVAADLAAFELGPGASLPDDQTRLLRSVRRGVDQSLDPGQDGARDYGMASGILETLAANANLGKKAVFWAHNAHVSGGGPEGFPWTGTILRARLGQDYAVLGCFSMEGILMAKDARVMARYIAPDGSFLPGMPSLVPGRIPFKVPAGFIEDILGRRMGRGVVFMSDLTKDPVCAEFLSGRKIQCCGAGATFDPAWSPDDRMPFGIADYDAIFFVPRSTPPENVQFPTGTNTSRTE